MESFLHKGISLDISSTQALRMPQADSLQQCTKNSLMTQGKPTGDTHLPLSGQELTRKALNGVEIL